MSWSWRKKILVRMDYINGGYEGWVVVDVVNIMDVGGVNLELFEFEDYGMLRIECDVINGEIVINDRLMIDNLGKENDKMVEEYGEL